MDWLRFAELLITSITTIVTHYLDRRERNEGANRSEREKEGTLGKRHGVNAYDNDGERGEAAWMTNGNAQIRREFERKVDDELKREADLVVVDITKSGDKKGDRL